MWLWAQGALEGPDRTPLVAADRPVLWEALPQMEVAVGVPVTTQHDQASLVDLAVAQVVKVRRRAVQPPQGFLEVARPPRPKTARAEAVAQGRPDPQTTLASEAAAVAGKSPRSPAATYFSRAEAAAVRATTRSPCQASLEPVAPGVVAMLALGA